MNNPVAGQTYKIVFSTSENLSGATVTIEYKSENGKLITGITPDAINTSTGLIEWIMEPNITQVGGLFTVRVKIVNPSNEVLFNSNDITVFFEKKF